MTQHLPCPICNGVEGCDHSVPERKAAAERLGQLIDDAVVEKSLEIDRLRAENERLVADNERFHNEPEIVQQLEDELTEKKEVIDELRARVAELEAGNAALVSRNRNMQNVLNDRHARVAELEGALRDIVIPSTPLKLDRYTKARALLSSNPSTQR